jgi:CubicO group peptidase (beta-lactamase class C family)
MLKIKQITTTFHSRLSWLMVLLLLLLTSCGSGDSGPIAVDPSQLESFADEFFPEQIEELHIPGLILIVVQDGEILFVKGYGSSNLESGETFSHDQTIVRIGSVSKLFVATSVMQMVERGLLDLHVDINRYLTTFQIEDTYPEPITLAHLLTHTGGFQDPPYVSNTDPLAVEPLGRYLAEHMPPRTAPPGEEFIYSNHGYALAAYVVEEVSGIPFDQYVMENILLPLGMEKSRYLLSPPLPDRLAIGYVYEDGEHVPQPMDYDSDYPGGSIVSTADDIAKFMLAHLQDGCYQGVCILESETLDVMHQQQADTSYEGQAVTYGFTEGLENNQRLIGHSGSIRGFGNNLTLIPEHSLGYFFSFNAECINSDACKIIPAFREAFLDEFFPSGLLSLFR